MGGAYVLVNNYTMDHDGFSCRLTLAISGSRPWANHTAGFYRESAASLCSAFLIYQNFHHGLVGCSVRGELKVNAGIVATGELIPSAAKVSAT